MGHHRQGTGKRPGSWPHIERRPGGVIRGNVPILSGERKQDAAEVLRSPANVSAPCAVQVIPNKFAALSSDVRPTRNLQPFGRRINGFGFHEVIIDRPDHAPSMALLPDEHVASLLRVYGERVVGQFEFYGQRTRRLKSACMTNSGATLPFDSSVITI